MHTAAARIAGVSDAVETDRARTLGVVTAAGNEGRAEGEDGVALVAPVAPVVGEEGVAEIA